MVGQVIDLVFVEMLVKVEGFGFGFEVGVVDFVEEFVGEDSLDMMEDIDSMERIFHEYFSFLEPKFEFEIEIEDKVVAKNSNLEGAHIHLVVKTIICCPCQGLLKTKQRDSVGFEIVSS